MGADLEPLIAVRDVAVALSGGQVLRGVDLDVARGECVALLGPSGSGKSTLLRVLLGLLAPDRGTVHLSGRAASSAGRVLVPPEERHLAIVFQDLGLWPHLSVADNLAFGLESRGVPRPERAVRIAAMLDRVGLGGKANRRPGELSGGERQRVAIARALVLDPVAVLLDEPLASLDIVLKQDVLDLLNALLAERGTTALYVTHDPREAMAVARRFAVMEGGLLVQQGSMRELCTAPATPFVAQVARVVQAHGLP